MRSHDPVHRSRMRDAFLAAARDVHAELRSPRADDFADLGRELEPEERAVLAQAAHWYVHVFGDRAGDLGRRRARRPRPSGGGCASAAGWISPCAPTTAATSSGSSRSGAGGFPTRIPSSSPPSGSRSSARRRGSTARRCGWPGSTSCGASCASAPSNPTSDTRSPSGSSRRVATGARTDRGSGRGAGVRLRRVRLRRRVPRAPRRARTTAAGATCSRASCTSRRPASTPGAGARANGATATCSASRPATAIPVPCTASRCTTCCGSCTSRGRVATPPTSTTCSSRTGSTTTTACVANWRATPSGARLRPRRSRTRSTRPASTPPDHALHGDRAARRARGCTTACSTPATTRPGRCGATASPTTPRRVCRRGCSRR